MLIEACPEDPFGKTRNPLHSKTEQEQILNTTNWQIAGTAEAKILGKLITSAGSLVHGLYNDVVTDFGWDTYGPYENQNKDGKEYTLLIRNFPDLCPIGLWPKDMMSSVKQLEIFQLYQDVEWTIGCVGCHTIVKSGSPITGLKYYSVVADGKLLTSEEINNLILDLAQKAEKIYLQIRQMNFEQLKEMVMLQECYQLKKLFEAVAMDQKPTEEMYAAIKNKALLTNVLPHGVMMTTLEEYKKVFHLTEFDQEVLKPYANKTF